MDTLTTIIIGYLIIALVFGAFTYFRDRMDTSTTAIPLKTIIVASLLWPLVACVLIAGWINDLSRRA